MIFHIIRIICYGPPSFGPQIYCFVFVALFWDYCFKLRAARFIFNILKCINWQNCTPLLLLLIPNLSNYRLTWPWDRQYHRISTISAILELVFQRHFWLNKIATLYLFHFCLVLVLKHWLSSIFLTWGQAYGFNWVYILPSIFRCFSHWSI